MTNHYAGDVIEAKSAGSQPVGEVHPLTIKYLAQANIATDDLVSQSWDDFETFAPDVVVTVCDSAAGETCPVWFGKSIKVHWGLADPSKVEGSEEQKAQAFKTCMQQIETRVASLRDLANRGLTGSEFTEALNNLTAK